MKSFVFLFSFLLLGTIFINAQEAINESRWVTAESGLRMRESADLKAKTIATIPYGDEVILLEEKGDEITISGATGKWSKIQWKEKQGWAFGGFLTKVKGLEILQDLPLAWIDPASGEAERGMKILPEGMDGYNYPCLEVYSIMNADIYEIIKVEKENGVYSLTIKSSVKPKVFIIEYNGGDRATAYWQDTSFDKTHYEAE
jgi:hypothetical protein